MKERITKVLSLMNQGSSATSVRDIPLDRILANPFQPRRRFDKQELEELAASIKNYGLLQPILVRPKGNFWYEIIAGERRVRAFRLLDRKKIPALVRDLSDEDMGLFALLENLQRQDLSFWEEAEGYARLLEEFNLTQEELAQRLGKSQSTIANKLRLLRLPDSIRHNISREIFTERHARALLRLPEQEIQEQVAEKIAADGLTVQATEQLIATMLGEVRPKEKKSRVIRVYKDIRLFQQCSPGSGRTKKSGLKSECEGKRDSGQLGNKYCSSQTKKRTLRSCCCS